MASFMRGVKAVARGVWRVVRAHSIYEMPPRDRVRVGIFALVVVLPASALTWATVGDAARRDWFMWGPTVLCTAWGVRAVWSGLRNRERSDDDQVGG